VRLQNFWYSMCFSATTSFCSCVGLYLYGLVGGVLGYALYGFCANCYGNVDPICCAIITNSV
jgi:hypothetical protein